MKKENRERLIGHLAIFLSMVIFGLNGPISDMLLKPENKELAISPWLHVFSRFVGATILFWACSPFIKAKELEKKDFWKVFFAGICVVMVNLGFFTFALQFGISPVDQSLIATSGPIITLILAAIVLKEPITKLKAFGVLIGSAGVLMLVLGNQPEGEHSNLWGALLAFLATVGYAVYLTLFKPIIEKYHPIVLMKWMFLFSTIIILPFSIESVQTANWSGYTSTIYGLLFFVVFFSTFIAYLLLPISQKRIRPTVVSMYNYLMPVVAMIAALEMGREKFTLMKGISAILIVIGVYMVTISKSRKSMLKEQARAKQEANTSI